jgi:hypothetical protein
MLCRESVKLPMFTSPEISICTGEETALLNLIKNTRLYNFTMYPSLNTKVYRYDSNSYLTYNPAPQYDSQNRLVKYKMFNGDSPDFYEEFDIVYYK